MDGYIPKQEAIEKMLAVKHGWFANRRMVQCEGIQTAIDILLDMPGRAVQYEPEEAKIVTVVEPWWPGARTGRDVHRCGFCTTQVSKKDRFCSFCGRKLISGEEEKKRG